MSWIKYIYLHLGQNVRDKIKMLKKLSITKQYL